MIVSLRPLADDDLDTLFEWERDPHAVRLAAFTRADPSDRPAFDAHYARVRSDPSNLLYSVDDDEGTFVGTVASFTIDGDREISYWIDPARWGQGLAGAALAELITLETTRPLFARVAEHNVGSATVLARAGFVDVGTETSYANGVGGEIVEHIYQLTG